MTRFFNIILLVLGIASSLLGQHNSFIENKGQWAENFDYKYLFGNGSVFIDESGMTVHLVHPDDIGSTHPNKSASQLLLDYSRHHAYKVHFVGANLACKKTGAKPLDTHHNYILGNDPARWQKNVPLYQEVIYHNIYPNIDLKYYFSAEGNLKYDFIVHPKGDPGVIKLKYEGADDLDLVYGNLMVRTSIEDVLESAPYSYQLVEEEKKKVNCEYQLDGNLLSYKVSRYKKSETLIIDPMLVFSSYTGAKADNFGFTATPSADGSLYAAGIVFLTTGTYPTTMGAFQQTRGGGGIDIAITKFSSDGSNLVYSTYLGGAGNELPFSLYERRDGSLVILGVTGSNNFPVSFNAYQRTLKSGVQAPDFFNMINTFPNGTDVVVTILDSAGSGIEGSTYFGGHWVDGLNLDFNHNYGDKFRGEVIADSLGNIYLVSSTFSQNMPTTIGAYMPTYKGKQDGFVASLSADLSSLRWGSFIGGSASDNALGIKLGATNNVYVAGAAKSDSIPFNTDALNPYGLGGSDGYIVNLDRNNGSFFSGTYNGTDKRDANFFVEVDDNGQVYVMGQTRGLYPIDSLDVYNNYGSAQFIHKLSSNLKVSIKATVFGDSSHARNNISPTAFMVDECKNVYVSGWGGGPNRDTAFKQGYTQYLPITTNALQTTTDGADFYFFVLDATWRKVNYATYFGGSNGDHVDGGTSRFAKDGTIYQAVCACGGPLNSDLPVTSTAYSRQNGSGNCNLAAVKIDFEGGEVVARAKADVDSSCVPYVANISNLSHNADTYYWVDPDGTVINSEISKITVTEPGPHSYMLVVMDTTCNYIDSTELVLFGFKDTVHASFQLDYDSCSNDFLVKTINTSLTADNYFWDFGDGFTSTLKDPVHRYMQSGSFVIKLFTKNSYCILSDSTEMVVKFKTRINTADFRYNYEPCKDGSSSSFTAIGTGFQEYNWDFGNGESANGPTVEYDFKESGRYTIRLSLRDTICQRYLEKDTVLEIFADGYSPDIPNVFTPNGDGLNDEFGLPDYIPHGYYKSFAMKIYNRWGSLLYETTDINALWDGTMDGNAMAEGVYFYTLYITDGCGMENEYNGFVHLMKN